MSEVEVLTPVTETITDPVTEPVAEAVETAEHALRGAIAELSAAMRLHGDRLESQSSSLERIESALVRTLNNVTELGSEVADTAVETAGTAATAATEVPAATAETVDAVIGEAASVPASVARRKRLIGRGRR